MFLLFLLYHDNFLVINQMLMRTLYPFYDTVINLILIFLIFFPFFTPPTILLNP